MRGKRLCIISQDLYSLGGVQRTISEICNFLADSDDVDIYVLMHTYQRNNYYFHVDERVHIIDIAEVFSDRFSLFYKPLNMINRRLKFLDNSLGVRISKSLYYRSKELDKLVDWINGNGFDVVIGATASYALLVSFIANRIQAKAIGWMHSTYKGYYRMRGQNLYGSERLNKEMIGNLDRLFVLNSRDAETFSKNFGTRCDIL